MRSVTTALLLATLGCQAQAADNPAFLIRTQADEIVYAAALYSRYYSPDEVALQFAKKFSQDQNEAYIDLPLKSRPAPDTRPIEARIGQWWQAVPGDPQYQPGSEKEVLLRPVANMSPAAQEKHLAEIFRKRVASAAALIDAGKPVCMFWQIEIKYQNGAYQIPVWNARYASILYNGRPLKTVVPAQMISEPQYQAMTRILSAFDKNGAPVNAAKTCWKPDGYVRHIPKCNALALCTNDDIRERGALVGDVELVEVKSGKSLFTLPSAWFN